MTHLLYWCCPLCARCAATLGTTCKHTLTHLCVSVVIEQLRKYLLFSFCMFLKCFPEILKIKESFYLKCKVDFHRVHPWECRWTRVCACVCVCVRSADGGKQCSCRMTVLAAAVTWKRREERKKWSEERKTSCRCVATVLWTDTHLLCVFCAWSNYCFISGATSLIDVFSACSELKFTVIWTHVMFSVHAAHECSNQSWFEVNFKVKWIFDIISWMETHRPLTHLSYLHVRLCFSLFCCPLLVKTFKFDHRNMIFEMSTKKTWIWVTVTQQLWVRWHRVTAHTHRNHIRHHFSGHIQLSLCIVGLPPPVCSCCLWVRVIWSFVRPESFPGSSSRSAVRERSSAGISPYIHQRASPFLKDCVCVCVCVCVWTDLWCRSSPVITLLYLKLYPDVHRDL